MRTISYLAVCVLLLSNPVAANELPRPQGTVILTLTGQLSFGNSHHGVELDMALLKALPTHQIKTKTPWTDGEAIYRGALLIELLDWAGAADASEVKLTALNNYSATLSLREIQRYPIVLAYEADGKKMRVRDKGPVWVVYPLSDFPELDTPKIHSHMVWQLRHIEVR
ncbi:molybdopterin-dependent oxidoreductase [Neptunomonas sp. XY-337]|uniref:molybdopterin-dependent oxidoreductase n=1 Tax=Neptunomonas sp. XY-337 TaxID=2561897 RepID=UPI0010AB49A4|nr:molybdopterin-dependent oxidoreductase [Neptunomonas sp. XY-337]